MEQEKPVAISVRGVEKIYKLYDKSSDRVREALGLTRKARHKKHYALNGIDMEIYQGECVGIIGTNGSGKSTILKIITGVLSPSRGEVEVNGRISALLELGAGFNMEYNGIENVYLNGMMIGFSEKEIDEKLQDILDFADIGEYVYQPVKTYSSGMFVRLAFAVAINIEPEILIVDEALSVGDVFFQAKCYHKFEEFKEMGKTIVFVSHDLSSISKYCDRVVLLNKGVKLGEGSPKEMIDTYKRVLVGQYEIPDDAEHTNLLHDKDIREKAAGKAQEKKAEEENGAKQGINPELLEYGSKKARIEEYGLTDCNGVKTTAVIKGQEYTIRMKAVFTEDCPAPIFAFTIKNIKGTEITGTNTMVEKAFLEPVKAGEVKEITFTQHMNLQGGEYLLSLGVTGYEGDDFTVYHRLYDVLNMTVISDKDTVGFYDPESAVQVL
ncbi:MAG: ABC transporter ATP-binding protein [Lachnospiraceae bacterium]|nr:ABC transporter ATP-binding protein [Lachnospiraceae bacterium]